MAGTQVTGPVIPDETFREIVESAQRLRFVPSYEERRGVANSGSTSGQPEIMRASRFISRDDLLKELRELAALGDPEIAHSLADKALMDWIADDEIQEAFDAIAKWYA